MADSMTSAERRYAPSALVSPCSMTDASGGVVSSPGSPPSTIVNGSTCGSEVLPATSVAR